MIKYIHEKYSKNESIRKKILEGESDTFGGKDTCKGQCGFLTQNFH